MPSPLLLAKTRTVPSSQDRNNRHRSIHISRRPSLLPCRTQIQCRCRHRSDCGARVRYSVRVQMGTFGRSTQYSALQSSPMKGPRLYFPLLARRRDCRRAARHLALSTAPTCARSVQEADTGVRRRCHCRRDVVQRAWHAAAESAPADTAYTVKSARCKCVQGRR